MAQHGSNTITMESVGTQSGLLRKTETLNIQGGETSQSHRLDTMNRRSGSCGRSWFVFADHAAMLSGAAVVVEPSVC